LRGVSIAQSRFLGVPTKTAALVSAAKSASEAQGIIRRAIYESRHYSRYCSRGKKWCLVVETQTRTDNLCMGH
jgi:hypothetical protein